MLVRFVSILFHLQSKLRRRQPEDKKLVIISYLVALLTTGFNRGCVCGNPVSKHFELYKWFSLKDNDVLSYTFWIDSKEKQGGSDGRCENAPGNSDP